MSKASEHKYEVEANRNTSAIEKYNYILGLLKDADRDTNPNVIRDLLATKLLRAGLFRKYSAAVKWSTNFVACHYDQGKRTQDQELAQ